MPPAPPPLRDADRDAARDATVTAVLGPTNTGKTHFAIDRMLAHRSGVIGFPLRLLAREVYDRVVAMRGPRAAALITGEEKIAPAEAPYVICTVEAMPLDWGADFVAVDEIQLCADPDRGHVFTDRLLRARGRLETLFLGAESVRGRIAALIPKARFVTRPRFSTLTYEGPKKLSRLPPRSAVVAFSVESVYAIAELMRRQKGGAAVVMGALSPRTRNAQVALYQNGDVGHLVATDAIGMGLNLDLRHVAFAGTVKFDGRRRRPLTAQEMAQIAGRAGRHVADGTWGVTGEATAPDEDVVEQIATHRFDPAPRLMWRNHRLDFGATPALLRSLEAPPPHPDLQRAREAEDVEALRALWADAEIAQMAKGGPAVRLLWDVCQTPDFRKTSTQDHAALLGRIYRFLHGDAGVIPSDWIEGQVRRLDRTDGDIDALSKRLAYVRTWTYVANRGRWVDDPAGWRERTRAVEDRLSDALHDRLTKRFVDRRTSVLMQRLKQKERLVAEVSDTGDVMVEGHAVGRIEGFRFRPDPAAGAEELKTLRAASLQALQAQFAHRADRFYNAPDTEIDVTEQGGLMWGADAVGRLEPGPDQLSPKVRAFVEEDGDPAVAEKVARRLSHWIDRRTKALFEPLTALRDDPALAGLARGVAFQLVEALGVIPRRQIADDVKQLDQESRALLRKHGVRFGQHHVFMPALLKPAPTRFRILLWSLHSKLDDFPAPPPPGHVTIPAIPGAPEGFYVRAGYRLCGTRALRIDMLERLADLLRAVDPRAGFEASPEMLSITGCTLDQFADLMAGLGYHGEKAERPKAQRPAKGAAAPLATGPDAADAAPAETAPPTEAGEAVEPPVVEPTAVAETAEPSAVAETAEPSAVAETAEPSAVADRGAASAEAPPADADAAGVENPAESASAQGATADAVAAEAADPSTEAAQGAAGTPAPSGPVEMESFYTFTLAPRRPARDRGPRRDGPPRQGGGPREGAPPREGRAFGRGPGGGERRQDGGGPRHGGGRADAPRRDDAAPRPAEAAAEAPRPEGRRDGPGPEGRRQDGPRHGGPRPDAARTEPGRAEGGPRPAGGPGGRPAQGGGAKPGQRPGGPKPQGRPPRDEGPRVFSAGPQGERGTADPDSPFAILKQLKDRM
jgi:ATP-dependent RNA helicase SUPV3L1/SUV3